VRWASSRKGKRLAVLLASALAAAALIELGARLLVAPPLFRPGAVLDPVLGHRPVARERVENADERGAFSFVLNSEGYRGPELPAESSAKPDGTLRLLFLGDSFLFGRAVRDEELVDAATVRELAARSIPAAAWNLGVPDYGTLQELLLFQREGARVRPDVVVLLVFPGNDVANDCLELAGKTPGNDGDYVRPYAVDDGDALAFAHPLRAFLRDHLRAFAALEMHFLGLAAERGWSWATWGAQDPAELTRTGDAVLAPPPAGSAWDVAWRRTEELLARFRDEVHARGAELLVLVAPRRNQVQHEGFAEDLLASQPHAFDGLDWNYPERRLQAFCARERIPAVLLLEDLRAAIAADPTPVFAADFHFSGRAHALAARRTAEWIAEWVARRAQGAAFEPASDAFSAPVDVVAPERCLTALDFVRAPRFEFLGAGFGPWRLDWSGKGPGLPASREARLYLRTGRGDFLLRGAVPVKPPARIELAFDGVKLAHALEVTEKGAFELRVPRAELPAELPARTQVTLSVAVSGPTPRDVPWVLILRQIGFEEGLGPR